MLQRTDESLWLFLGDLGPCEPTTAWKPVLIVCELERHVFCIFACIYLYAFWYLRYEKSYIGTKTAANSAILCKPETTLRKPAYNCRATDRNLADCRFQHEDYLVERLGLYHGTEITALIVPCCSCHATNEAYLFLQFSSVASLRGSCRELCLVQFSRSLQVGGEHIKAWLLIGSCCESKLPSELAITAVIISGTR
jgi:hypothetical protein